MQIRHNFARAAATYDQFADVQAEVAERLGALLPPPSAGPRRIVELGCGTGNLTAKLRQLYPVSSIIAIDFAHQMLLRAAERLRGEEVLLICQDIATFLAQPGTGTVELFVSNATLQWLPDLGTVLAEMKRQLKPGGVLLFSIFGPESLSELQRAFNTVLPGKITLAAAVFKGRQEIRDLLDRHFDVDLEEEVMLTRGYDSVLGLLRQIGRTGTGGAHPRPLRLGRHHLAAMDDWFAVRYGKCLATYQIFFFRCSA